MYVNMADVCFHLYTNTIINKEAKHNIKAIFFGKITNIIYLKSSEDITKTITITKINTV